MNTCFVDPVKKTITITKEFLRKAGKVGTPEYNELLTAQRNNPDYALVVRSTKKPATEKPHIKYKNMEKFFDAFPDAKARLATYEKVKSISHIQPNPYAFVRDWFIATYCVKDERKKKYVLNPSVVPAAMMLEAAKAIDAPEGTICLPAA